MGIKHLTENTQGDHPEKTFCIVIEPKKKPEEKLTII